MTNNRKPTILLLEDEKAQRDYAALLLTEIGYDVKSYSYLEDALDALDVHMFDAFVVDLKIDVKTPANYNCGGDEFIRIAMSKYPDAPIAVLSAYFGDDWGARLSKLFMQTTSCLYYHIAKPGEEKLKEWAEKAINYYYLKNPPEKTTYHAEDTRVREIVHDLIPMVAAAGMPVFLLGETGTGKEGIARLIHSHQDNPFRQGPFIAVNCATVSDDLLLSELFGHVHGAYTGACEHRLGLFLEASGWKSKKDHSLKDGARMSYREWLKSCNQERIQYAAILRDYVSAENIVLMNNPYNIVNESQAEYIYSSNAPGTLFLDEIGDLTPAAEAALLRVLDGYGIRPLGYTGPALLPNCQIIAATNKITSTSDLVDTTYNNKNKGPGLGFRKELYHRLAGWVMELPPLRDRFTKAGKPEWIVSLQKWAAKDNMHFQDGVLEEYANSIAQKEKIWDGNWRELQYFYARAKALAKRNKDNHVIRKYDLEFAGKWVLLDASNVELEDIDNAGKEATIRLDCILALHHLLQNNRNESGEKEHTGLNTDTLDLCPETLFYMSSMQLLEDALRVASDAGRITNTSVDILMAKKSALKAWWRGNAMQIASIINKSPKYKQIASIVEKLSPSNFHLNSNGIMEVKNYPGS